MEKEIHFGDLWDEIIGSPSLSTTIDLPSNDDVIRRFKTRLSQYKTRHGKKYEDLIPRDARFRYYILSRSSETIKLKIELETPGVMML